jgi:voltage-gated potassium channel
MTMTKIKSLTRDLYTGTSRRALFFRYFLLAFDVTTICFFVLTSMTELEPWVIALDYLIVVVLILDFGARLSIARHKLRYLIQPVTIADVVVILTLLAPTLIDNLAFLRVLRALRLLRSHHVLKDLRSRYAFFARNEEILQSCINLMVFIFFVTALVYVFQVDRNPDITNYVDSLYFTVTTLTTTGFGDITLKGSSGRILSIIVMVLGVALFLRLVQTIFRPAKVSFECPDCGLKRHDPDAVHCKHCGRTLHIETEGL